MPVNQTTWQDWVAHHLGILLFFVGLMTVMGAWSGLADVPLLLVLILASFIASSHTARFFVWVYRRFIADHNEESEGDV